jgi:hypothetical protein
MKYINIKKTFKGNNIGSIAIIIALITLLYLLLSIYFANHFFFNTVINGVNVSLKSHSDAPDIIKDYIKNYKLQLLERDGEIEELVGQDIGLEFNENSNLSELNNKKNSFKWLRSVLRVQKYYVEDLYLYDEGRLENQIKHLKCLNREFIYPQNVSFKYLDGVYKAIEEVNGNKVNEDRLKQAITAGLLHGERQLDLNKENCYENPSYTLSSSKTSETMSLLNRYVSTNITYIFEDQREILNGTVINGWLSVDKNLNPIIDEVAVVKYLRELGKKYDTVGIPRQFKTSTGKKIEVSGGLYGWKINLFAETKALIDDIKLGKVIEREPIYAQRALPRGEDEIGDTYVEINISKQRLWFYKNGRLIAQGAVVTGNPNRANATPLGVYMLNYKQKGANLTGPDYEAEVTYWMPFFGNIGIHDATWRHSFGREIYKRNGSHGCVNAPLHLARKIYENIEDGTPIVLYE